MQGSVQDKLNRVRPPRVKITYDVETGGAQEKIELPFISGIFADLTGSAGEANLPPVAERKMVGLDADTFEEVMRSSQPSIDITTINHVLDQTIESYLEEQSRKANTKGEKLKEIDVEKLLKDAPKLGFSEDTPEDQYLVFEKMEHFEPEYLIRRVKPMGEIYSERVAFRELQSKSELIQVVQDVLETAIPQKKESSEEQKQRETVATELKTFSVKFNTLTDAIETEKQASPSKQMSDEDVQTLVGVQTLAAEEDEEADAFQKRVKGIVDASRLTRISELNEDDFTSWFKGRVGPLYEEKEDSILSRVFSKGALIRNDETEPSLRSYEIVASFQKVVEFSDEQFKQLSPKAEAPSLAATFDNIVASIDEKLGRQLDEILHNSEFQALEATWRGMAYLLNNTELSSTLKLRVMNVSKKALLSELSKAVEFDQSSVFKRIYEYEYGTYGGHPYSMLVGGYEFSRSVEDQKLLRLMAEIAAAAHAPFVASAYAELFDMETFESLAKPRDLSKIFESVELSSWQAFRESEDSRYVSLALPRVLFRLPWGGEKGAQVDIIDYEESVMNLSVSAKEKEEDDLPYQQFSMTKEKSVNGSNMLWGNAAWLLAQRITNAHATFGWTAAIRGVEGGGLVEFLPNYTYTAADGDIDQVCPTQVSITDRREKELNDLGFMAICHCKGTSKAAFFGGQSTNLPKKYLSDSATANAQLSSQLPYMLCASRFAHYIKVMMRTKIGSFMTRDNVEKYLNNWIAQYILLDDEAPQAVKASYPLRAANVVVTDNAAKPGSYNATVFLRPHFQLEELTTSIRLVTEIPT